jgi:hypothetical protein
MRTHKEESLCVLCKKKKKQKKNKKKTKNKKKKQKKTAQKGLIIRRSVRPFEITRRKSALKLNLKLVRIGQIIFPGPVLIWFNSSTFSSVFQSKPTVLQEDFPSKFCVYFLLSPSDVMKYCFTFFCTVHIGEITRNSQRFAVILTGKVRGTMANKPYIKMRIMQTHCQ